MLTIPVMYIFFKLGYGVLFSYYCILGANILIFISNMIIFKYLVPEVKLMEYMWLFLKTAIVIAVSLIPVLYINRYYDESFLRLVVNSIVLLVALSILSYWFILDQSSRSFIKTKVQTALRKVGVH